MSAERPALRGGRLFSETVEAGAQVERLFFFIDGVAQPPVEVVNGIATLTVSNLPLGSHTIPATDSGGGADRTARSVLIRTPA